VGTPIDNVKLLTFSPETYIRPILCKIFPYKLHQNYHNQNIINISLANYPATMPEYAVPEDFTSEVITLIKTHFKETEDRDVDIEVFEGLPEA